MENEDKTERIDRYLDDMLTPEEKIAFEAEMAANPDFRFEMEAQEAVRNLISSQAEKEDLRRMFTTFHHELDALPIAADESSSKKKKGILRKLQWSNWSYSAIAASVAILIIGVWTVWNNINPAGNNATGNQEIRVDERNEVFRVPLLSWKTVDFKPVLQDKQLIDATIIRSREYRSHYRFNDILEIYSDKLTEKQQKISIAYDVDTKQYRLHIGNNSYPIRKAEQITPLTQP
ncbi:hypothetical protein GCM10007423_46800 [Dyadobacter endophyticus]|uniref:Zinc-finger domain-containing protein n=1 Tax=Dyadobacter endophyticus TaxID=1749036 RepID=A0ABQ1Z3Y8_9BACT|nr:hypothetical protein [Dyadobacter endophyticus]GGH46789.1 hypothetical protein GCM10007423_46800 [Dyadobacter endophyticus]